MDSNAQHYSSDSNQLVRQQFGVVFWRSQTSDHRSRMAIWSKYFHHNDKDTIVTKTAYGLVERFYRILKNSLRSISIHRDKVMYLQFYNTWINIPSNRRGASPVQILFESNTNLPKRHLSISKSCGWYPAQIIRDHFKYLDTMSWFKSILPVHIHPD